MDDDDDDTHDVDDDTHDDAGDAGAGGGAQLTVDSARLSEKAWASVSASSLVVGIELLTPPLPRNLETDTLHCCSHACVNAGRMVVDM